MDKKTVLLLIDQRFRDSIGISLVFRALKDMGVSVHLCNKRNMLQMYEHFRPKVVAFSDTGTYFANWCRYMAKSSHIVLIPQEGGNPIKDLIIKRFQSNDCGQEPFIKGISKVFLWGRKSVKWLLEAGVFNERQVVVSGTPRTDVHSVIRKMGKAKPDNSRVGFANRGEAVNMIVDSMVSRIDSSKYSEDVVGYTGEDRHWEDWIWHSVAQLRYLFILIDKLSKGGQFSLVFRPDPYENIKTYAFLKKRYLNCELNTDSFLGGFLAGIDLLITEFSTTGIEALIMNIPVISIQKLLGDRLTDHDRKENHVNTKFMQFYWQPQSVDEALEMIDQCKTGQLPFTPDEQGLKQYLKNYYNWPRQEPSCLIIAREIAALLEESVVPLRGEGIESMTLEGCSVLPKRLAFLERDRFRFIFSRYYLFDLYYLLADLYRKRLSSMLRREFYPFHIHDLNQAKKIWKLLKADT